MKTRATPRNPFPRTHPLTDAVRACLRQNPTRHIAPVVGLSLLLACPAAALADTFTVTNTNDAGPGSLRQAVLDANANPGADEVLFASTVTGTIPLTSGALKITEALTLEGPGSDVLTLDAGGISPILDVQDTFYVSGFTLANAAGNAIDAFTETWDQPLTIRDCVITGSTGSAIAVQASAPWPAFCGKTVLLEDSVITGNGATAISSNVSCYETRNASLTVRNSTISANGGGGIETGNNTYCSGQGATIEDSVISDNGGDGISGAGTGVALRNSWVTGNRGDGVNVPTRDDHYCVPIGSLTSERSLIAENQGHGVSGRYLGIENSTIAKNLGAGIQAARELYWYRAASVTIAGTTIEGNSQGGVHIQGALFARRSQLTILNSTVSGNQNANDGAGIYIWAYYDVGGIDFNIKNTTITSNVSNGRGGGIFYGGGDADASTIENSVVAGNTASENPDLVIDGVVVNFSLIQDPGDSVLVETVPGSNIIGFDPLLGPLQDNGGPTLTHALLPGSPAIDRGDPDFTPPPDYDQRGEGFYRVANGRIDMGAFERQIAVGWLQSLGDVSGDGTPDISVVQRDVLDRKRATVRDAANGSLINKFDFSAALGPVDVELMPDFGFGYTYAPNLAILGAFPPAAETRSVLEGDLIGSVAFNTRFAPVDLTVLPDQNKNGTPEVAMLGAASTKFLAPNAYPELVSVDPTGVAGDGTSSGPALSADGRFVAFASQASNLIPDDTNGTSDVFVRDRETGTTERVSVDVEGVEGNGNSGGPAISADGRFVAFESRATNLIPGGTSGWNHIFIRDRENGTTEQISVSSSGVEGNGNSGGLAISADGRFVAFESQATNLIPGGTNGWNHIFIHDRENGTTEQISVSSSGAEANGSCMDPAISADGRFVAFTTIWRTDNLVSGDTNGSPDIFVRDREAGTTERVSVDSSGTEANDDFYGSYEPAISADGRFVTFVSGADNLVPADTNGAHDVFVHDRTTGETERVSVDSSGRETDGGSQPAISGDGRLVAFTGGDGLVPDDTNGASDVFVHDRETGETERVSVSVCGIEGESGSDEPAISTEGRFVAFRSRADLVPKDNNFGGDIYVTMFETTPVSPTASDPIRKAILADQVEPCVVDADSTRVEIRDAVTGDLINNLWFAPRFEPRQAITLPDLNGNGSAEVGVVLTKADEPDRVVIHDSLTDEKVSVLMPWAPQHGFDLLQALPVPDADGNPTAKVALLLHEAASGKTLVRVTDALTNAQLAMVRGFNPDFEPVKLVLVSDLNGNGSEEYALLAREPDTGQVKASIRDGASNEAINTVWFDKACTPLDMVSIDDINANGAQELVLLERCGAEGTLYAVVKDAGTGERLNILKF